MDEWEKLRKQWLDMLLGDTEDVCMFPDKVAETDKRAQIHLSKIRVGENIQDLFEDQPITMTTQMTMQYRKIFEIVVAYKTYGGMYFQDAKVCKTLLFALEWMYNNRYGKKEKNNIGWRSTILYNWWDWKIGTPRYLIDIFMLMRDELSDSLIKRYLSLFQVLVPEPEMTGSNFLNICRLLIGAAILERNGNKLFSTLEKIKGVFVFCGDNRKEGYYEDGSYLFHMHHSMNATYGLEQVKYLALLIGVLKNTQYDFSYQDKKIVLTWICKGQIPFCFHGYYMRCVMGRYPDLISDFAVNLLIAAVEMSEYAQNDTKIKIERLIKEITESGACKNYEHELSFSQCRRINAIIARKGCSEQEQKYDRVFSHIDCIVQKKEDWAFSVAMNSERISGYESINGLNKYGWYHGDGMTQLMLKSDLEQYNRNYWEKINPYRIPGTTTDKQERYPVSTSLENDYMSGENFVGGACIRDKAVAAVMCLRAFHAEKGLYPPDTENINTVQPYHRCSLSAKKAWFVFDKEIVALGCDICANDGFNVETTLENRCLSFENIISAEGTLDIKLDKNGEEVDLSGKRWVNYGDMIGYVFPGDGIVKLARNPKNTEFVELWTEHGINPDCANYAYIILPNHTALETEFYAKMPGLEILSNTPTVQCVYQKIIGIKAFIFHKAGKFDEVEVSHPILLLLQQQDNRFKIVAADPTWKLNNIKIRLKGKWRLLHKCKRAGIEHKNGKTIISLNLTETQGESVEFDVIDDAPNGYYI
jgi:hyaluronate lyase